MAKGKDINDEEFLRQLTANRKGHGTSMVMTPAPTGPSKSLDEMLAEQMPEELKANITPDETSDGFVMIPIANIRRSPYQVCVPSDADYIDALAESIKETKGVISPIIVRPVPSESLTVKLFEFVAGEHRAIACSKLGYTSIPCVVRNLTDTQAAIALTADNAIKRNMGDFARFQHARMLRDNGFCKTDSEVASTLGVSKAAISQLNAFASLPSKCHELLSASPNLLSMRFAYEIRDIAAAHPDAVIEAIERLANGKIQPTSLKTWLTNKIDASDHTSNRLETRLPHPKGGPDIKISVTSHGARIQAADVNLDRLTELLKNNASVFFGS